MPISVAVVPSAIDLTLASAQAGGVSGLLSPISFCHWQADETTNIGYNFWSILFNAAQIAIAVYNAIKQEEIADKQMDLAERWYDHAEYKWERFRDHYMPLEKKLVREVSSAPVPKLDCLSSANRAKDGVNSAYDIMDRYLNKKLRAYNSCLHPTYETRLNNQKTIMQVDATNYNYVDDRWYRDYKDDKRWGRRSNVLNLGRNLSNMAFKYGSIAQQTFGAVGAQYNRAASSAMYALGYFGARNDTYMPHSYLGTAGRGEGGIAGTAVKQGSISLASLNPASGGIGQP